MLVPDTHQDATFRPVVMAALEGNLNVQEDEERLIQVFEERCIFEGGMLFGTMMANILVLKACVDNEENRLLDFNKLKKSLAWILKRNLVEFTFRFSGHPFFAFTFNYIFREIKVWENEGIKCLTFLRMFVDAGYKLSWWKNRVEFLGKWKERPEMMDFMIKHDVCDDEMRVAKILSDLSGRR